jgi:hypothetical protein
MYVPRMQFYYLWWITSWRWTPWLRVHCLRRKTKLSKTLCNRFWSWLIRTISSLNARLRSCVVWGGVPYTHSFRYPQRKKSGTVMSGEHAGHGMSPKRETTLWKRLRTTSMLQCDYVARFVPNVSCLCPGCVNVADLKDVDHAAMMPLHCEHFSTHSAWSTVTTVPYTASVFKLTYPQQKPVAWRNRTMSRNIKLFRQAMLCPNDGLCFTIKTKSCSSVR